MTINAQKYVKMDIMNIIKIIDYIFLIKYKNSI